MSYVPYILGYLIIAGIINYKCLTLFCDAVLEQRVTLSIFALIVFVLHIIPAICLFFVLFGWSL